MSRTITALFFLCLAAPLVAAEPPITAAAFLPNGKSVLLGSQAGLEVRSWPELKSLKTLDTKLAHIHDLAFSPKGDVLAVAGGKPAEEGTVELYQWPKGDLIRRETLQTDVVQAFAWRSDGKLWATASADRSARIHDAESGKKVHILEGHSGPVLALSFTPDGKVLVTASGDQTVRVWNVETGKPVRSFENHTAAVQALAFRPGVPADEPPMLATAGADKTLRLWQPTIGRLVRFARLPSEPLTLAWSRDGAKLLAGCADGHLRIVDPDTVKIVEDKEVLKGWIHTLVVAPDGDVLVAGTNGQVARVALSK